MGKAHNKFNSSAESLEDQRNLALNGKKKFTPKDLINLSPMSVSQEKFVSAYREGIPTIFQTGYPGVGKTAMAISEGLRDVLDPETPYKKIIIVRSAVQGRQIGFTPGEVDEKAAPYETPYIEIVNSLFTYNSVYDNLKACGMLEFTLSTFLRGCNLKDAVIIVDEFQNMDFAELDTVYTRSSGNSRVIFCGDKAQCDLQRTREKSGIESFISIFSSMHLYKDDYNDYSLLLPHAYRDTSDEEYEHDIPDYAHIEYSPKECVRNKQVRKYLIAKTKLGL